MLFDISYLKCDETFSLWPKVFQEYIPSNCEAQGDMCMCVTKLSCSYFPYLYNFYDRYLSISDKYVKYLTVVLNFLISLCCFLLFIKFRIVNFCRLFFVCVYSTLTSIFALNSILRIGKRLILLVFAWMSFLSFIFNFLM